MEGRSCCFTQWPTSELGLAVNLPWGKSYSDLRPPHLPRYRSLTSENFVTFFMFLYFKVFLWGSTTKKYNSSVVWTNVSVFCQALNVSNESFVVVFKRNTVRQWAVFHPASSTLTGLWLAERTCFPNWGTPLVWLSWQRVLFHSSSHTVLPGGERAETLQLMPSAVNKKNSFPVFFF